MLTRPLLATLFLLFVAPLPAVGQPLPRALPEEAGMDSDRLGRLTAVLQDYVDEGRLPGGEAIVLRRGSVVYHQAFGWRDIESGDSLQIGDRFRIASQTKALVSVAIMMLQDEGKLLIGDPVSRYLPAFRNVTVALPDPDGGYERVPASTQYPWNGYAKRPFPVTKG